MPLPTTRIYLTKREQTAILGPVNTILNGLYGASLGFFPNRHPSDRVDFIASDVFVDAQYSPEMAARVVPLRNRLMAIRSDRMRIDVIDITLCIFAVGVAKRAKAISRKNAKALKTKLEKLRKRAMRTLISHSGKAAYEQAASRCRRFEAWCRYNLLYFHLPRRVHPPALKMLWRDQLNALILAAQMAVSERSHVTVSEEEILRQAKLALAEVRRGRHPTTPMELLKNPQEAKEFMFTFVSQRIDLHPLKPRRMWQNERQSVAEEGINTAPMLEAPDMAPAEAISVEEVQSEVASWIRENVDSGFRRDVLEEVVRQFYEFGRLPPQMKVTGSLEEIIEARRPDLTPQTAPELISYLVDWVIDWVMTLNRNPHLVCQTIENGFAQVFKESK